MEDHDAKVQEKGNHEYQLRNEFTEDVYGSFKVNVIPEGEGHTK